MRITRVQAVQAHYVPKQAHAPRGPFPPEMQGFNPRSVEFDGMGALAAANIEDLEVWEDDANPAAQPEIITEYQPENAEDGAGFEPGATAQNNFRPERRFRCRHCHAVVMEFDLDDHECGE